MKPALPDIETLMAFADGELDATQRAQVQEAMHANPELHQRLEQMRQQRLQVSAAFADVLNEPVPDRLSRLLQTSVPRAAPAQPAAAIVIPLDTARTQRVRPSYRLSWAQLGGMAASVVLGVLMGVRFLGSGADPALGLHTGPVAVGSELDRALTTQLANVPEAGAHLAVQLSFVDKHGHYCRSFSTAVAAGLACRQAGHWEVQQMVPLPAQTGGEVRMAASSLPPALLDAVDQRMAPGGTLDAAAERAARVRGWKN